MKVLYIFLIFIGITTNLFATVDEQGKRTTNSTISLGSIMSSKVYMYNRPSLTYNYFLNKNLELELGLGLWALTSGLKYHFYINENLTTYISINGTRHSDLCGGENFSLFSSLIGLRYETDFGLTTYLGVGRSFTTSYTRKTTECDYRPEEKIDSSFHMHGVLKLGYSF